MAWRDGTKQREKKEKEGKEGKERKKAGKEKTSYEEIPSLIGDGSDYHVYHMTKKDKVIAFLLGGGGGFLATWLFFGNVFLSALVFALAGLYVQPFYQNYKCEKRKKALLLQFRDLLETLTASYSAGKNTLEAFSDAVADLEHIYTDEADIVKETELIVGGMRNNLNVEELLLNFAKRSGLDDVQNFADVFRVAIRQGANIKDIIFSTRDVIGDKIEIEMEINTIMSGSKNELYIMMVMPLVIIVSLNGMGSGTSDNGLINVVVKLVAISLFALAYWLGKKFTKIEI